MATRRSPESVSSLSVLTDETSRISRWGLSILGSGSVFVLWYLVTDVFGLFRTIILPSPIQIITEMMEFRNLIYSNFWPTFGTALFGFFAAVVLGTLLAGLFTLSRKLTDALMPIVVSMNSVPRITLAPLIIFYTGGFGAKSIVATWVAFFPMFLNAYQGMNILQEEQESLLHTFGATTWQEYRYIRIPNSIPHLFDGMKIAMTLAIVGSVVAEFVGAGSGLGYLTLFALRDFRMPLVFGLTGLMGLVSVGLFFVLFFLQDRLVYWKETKLFG